MKAVIQAGGKGTRLRPYTFVLPKPMMPVGDLPVIEILLKWMRRWGIKEAYITTGYLGHLIRAHCNDGCQYDMKIKYSNLKRISRKENQYLWMDIYPCLRSRSVVGQLVSLIKLSYGFSSLDRRS